MMDFNLQKHTHKNNSTSQIIIINKYFFELKSIVVVKNVKQICASLRPGLYI